MEANYWFRWPLRSHRLSLRSATRQSSARQLAKRIVKVGLAGEALVFLEYLPGGAAPAQALVRLDGSSASIPFEKLLKGVCLDNETVWRDFNECNASFESLACWGHHFMGLPWKR